MKPNGNSGAPGAGQSDREVFERVWRRVMPEEREGCPVTLNPPSEEKGQCQPAQNGRPTGNQRPMGGQRSGGTNRNNQRPSPMEERMTPLVEVQPAPETVCESGGELALRSPGPSDVIGNDFPDLHDVPCLGSQAVGSVPLLQAMIAQELRDARFYQALSRRAGGNGARLFSAMASDEWRHAKRLSAAYFLISGVRYWPEPQGKVNLGSYLNSLRQRFIAEQNGAAAYRAPAEECRDACLRELFLEHALDEGNHANQIRMVVEQL